MRGDPAKIVTLDEIKLARYRPKSNSRTISKTRNQVVGTLFGTERPVFLCSMRLTLWLLKHTNHENTTLDAFGCPFFIIRLPI
jgi:hypothetical protein